MMVCTCQWIWWIESYFFFFNDTATTEIYTLSLHDALPILGMSLFQNFTRVFPTIFQKCDAQVLGCIAEDRKSTRLNSSHANISYAVFCLKKKKNKTQTKREISIFYTSFDYDRDLSRQHSIP